MNNKEEKVNFLFDYTSVSEYSDNEKDKYKSAFKFKHLGLYESQPSEKTYKETLFSKFVRCVISSLCYIFVVCTLPISFPWCVRKVPALERLVIFRLGRIEKVKGPGFILIMPCIDRWIKVDLHAQLFKTPIQQLLTRDGAILEVCALVHYQIVDVVRSVMQVEGVEQVFKKLVQQCINTAVTQRDEEDVTRQTHILQRDLQAMLNKSTVAWGLEVTQVDIPPVQILKSGEARDPVANIMTAFNAAIGGQTTTAPLISMEQTSITQGKTVVADDADCIRNVDEAFSFLSKIVQTVMSQSSFQGQDGLIRLEISDVKRNFYLVIKNGVGDLYEDLMGTAQNEAGVTLRLTSQVLVQMLAKRLSPLKAYANGLISVEGDWSLLKNFTQLIASNI